MSEMTKADRDALIRLNDLGVVRWQPPEEAATQLKTPLTPAPADSQAPGVRAIGANPGASDRVGRMTTLFTELAGPRA